MTLDESLLQRARSSAGQLEEAERKASLARAEHHTAVRRLHLAGGTLREIAAAMAMSHQRVAQIVEGAGGSWWQRVWRTRKPKRDAVCTFCGRPPSEVAKLIAGPDVFICDACVSRAAKSLKDGARHGSIAPAPPKSRAACSFCGKPRRLALGPESSICEECLATCRGILDTRG